MALEQCLDMEIVFFILTSIFTAITIIIVFITAGFIPSSPSLPSRALTSSCLTVSLFSKAVFQSPAWPALDPPYASIVMSLENKFDRFIPLL